MGGAVLLLNGAAVRYWRTRLGLTQAELGLLCGLYPQHISLLEQGKRRRVRHNTVVKLALAFEVEVEALVLARPQQAGRPPWDGRTRAAWTIKM